MKRTPLKRSTKQLKRTPIKHKYNKDNSITKSVRELVLIRSNNQCEVPGCQTPNGDYRGLCFMHITHRKMGGRNGLSAELINDPRNIARGCYYHHDIIDNRIKSDNRENILEHLKRKIDWYDWFKEYKGLL